METSLSISAKISALNGLRALATIGIFLFHAGLLLNGTFPVTLFFMLSGFFMFYTKRQTIKWSTGLKKIKTFYPLHLITFFLSLPVMRIWLKWAGAETIKSALLNLLLLQAWFEKYALTFNALSWYLSATLFLYLISYPLVLIVKRIKYPMVATGVTLALIIWANNSALFAGINLYINPLYRVLDFFLGMLLAQIYSSREDDEKAQMRFPL